MKVLLIPGVSSTEAHGTLLLLSGNLAGGTCTKENTIQQITTGKKLEQAVVHKQIRLSFEQELKHIKSQIVQLKCFDVLV